MSEKKSIRNAYGETLATIAQENGRIVALEADVGNSSKSILFGKKFPSRYFNVGIAEGNMVAMAAGFAACGWIPFVNTFSAFMLMRGADPIRSLIAYTHLNVKLAGTYAGLSDSYDGASHQAIADMAFMRAMPNMVVLNVADSVETAAATRAAAEWKGPVYLRLSRAEVPVIYSPNRFAFTIGKGIQLMEGEDVTIIATGYMVSKGLEAAQILQTKGIQAGLLDIHTVKPIDEAMIVRAAQRSGAVVTAEEHSVYGGLGSAVAEVLARKAPVPVEMVGIRDEFAESGDYEGLLNKYGLSAQHIVEKAELALRRKKAR